MKTCFQRADVKREKLLGNAPKAELRENVKKRVASVVSIRDTYLLVRNQCFHIDIDRYID